jgi:hypothetical protein
MIKIKLMLSTFKASLGYFFSYTTREKMFKTKTFNNVMEENFNGLIIANVKKKKKKNSPNLKFYNIF